MTPAAIVVVGASAGAVEALSAILPALPSTFRPPVVVVVHMGPRDRGLLPELFGSRCALNVKEASDKEPLQPGTIYFAPADYHLLIEREGTLALSSDELVNFSRPSIDVLFDSAAELSGPPVAALVLSGANADGASGARAIFDRGGVVMVQSPETSYCDVMPKAAIERCPGARVIALPAIAGQLLRWSETC